MSYTKLRPYFTFDEDRLSQLQSIAPEAFADGHVNWEALQEALGEHLEDDEQEHFGLFWPGKKEARRQAGVPPVGTLVPKLGEGVDEDTTRNIFIEGENLEVLKLLQKSYAGRVKMIYIDPPYNTGNDFVYDDNFTEGLDDYLRRTGMIDDEGRRLTTNSKADGRFHSKWLSMMYPRLRLARNLLRDDGVIFVSIDDNEIHHLRILMNEVFGEENFVGVIIIQTATDNNPTQIKAEHEYMLAFTKLRETQTEWFKKSAKAQQIQDKYEELQTQYGAETAKIQKELRAWIKLTEKELDGVTHYDNVDAKGVFHDGDVANTKFGGYSYPVIHPVTKRACKIPDKGYRFPEETMKKLIAADDIMFGTDETTLIKPKKRLASVRETLRSVVYEDGRASTKIVESLIGRSVFQNPKSHFILQNIFDFVLKDDDILLDFFAGSGSSAHAVWNIMKEGKYARFMLVQLPEQTDPKSEAYKQGYKKISEITVSRLAKTVQSLKHTQADLGFQVFSLRHSNYKTWEDATHTDITKLELQFADAANPLIDGWKEADLLAEVMLLEGFPLDSRVALVDGVKGNRVHRVTSDFHEHSLLVCLDKTVKPQTIASLALQPTEVLITLDSALTDEQKLTLGDKGMLRTI